jgi:hypothetical protein
MLALFVFSIKSLNKTVMKYLKIILKTSIKELFDKFNNF